MVDIADIAKAQRLNSERSQIDAALKMMDDGMGIVSFGIGPKPSEEDRLGQRPFWVPADYMEIPPQMIEAIKTFLHQREDAIMSELSSIGVTGVEPQPRGAVGARTQPPPPRHSAEPPHKRK